MLLKVLPANARLSCCWHPLVRVAGLADAVLEDPSLQHQGHQILPSIYGPPVAAEPFNHLEYQLK